MKTSKTKKTYIIITIIFSLIVVAALTIEVTSFAMLSNVQSSVVEQEYYGEKLTEKEQILENISNSYYEVSEYEDLILETLPEEKEASKLIADINSLANKNGLKFTNVESIASQSGNSKASPSKVDPSLLQTIEGTNSYEMPLSISIEGSYSNVISFVRSLENYQRLINIDHIKTEKVEDDDTADYVKTTLRITAYFKR